MTRSDLIARLADQHPQLQIKDAELGIKVILDAIVLPFYANEQHKKQLIKDGYLPESEVEARNLEKRISNKVSNNQTNKSRSGVSVADELSKLEELRKKSILTDEEFQHQKKKLLFSA